MTPGRVHSIAGLLSGLVTGLFLYALLLAWPMRMLAMAGALGIAFVVTMRRDVQPLQRRHLIASGFILGYCLASAGMAVLDLIFPPLA
jgi:hypothetical protein